MATLLSYGTGNYDGLIYNISAGVTYRRAGQQFDVTTPWIISDFDLYLQKNGTPTGTISSYLYQKDTAGTVYTLVATGSTLNAASVTGTMAIYNFTITPSPTLSPGTYVALVEYTGGDASNYISVGGDNSSSTGTGQIRVYDGTNWATNSTQDFIYTLNGSVPNGSGMLGLFR